MNYPENSWSEDDIEKIKHHFSSGKMGCPAPNCDGLIEIARNDDLKPKFKKKGDFFLELTCDNCHRKHTYHMLGHFK
jgi:hypothetical protein